MDPGERALPVHVVNQVRGFVGRHCWRVGFTYGFGLIRKSTFGREPAPVDDAPELGYVWLSVELLG